MLFHNGPVLKHDHDINKGNDGPGQLILLHAVDNTRVSQFFIDHSRNRVPKIGLRIDSGPENVTTCGDDIIQVTLELLVLWKTILL